MDWIPLIAAVVAGVLPIIGTILIAANQVSNRMAQAIVRIETVGTLQASEIKEIKASVEKLEGVVATVAVQKAELQSLRDEIKNNTKRTDDTFTRIFTILDKPRAA